MPSVPSIRPPSARSKNKKKIAKLRAQGRELYVCEARCQLHKKGPIAFAISTEQAKAMERERVPILCPDCKQKLRRVSSHNWDGPAKALDKLRK